MPWSPYIVLPLILIAKVVEVTLTTLRIILLNKGFRIQATIISFFEIMIWVFVASTVLNGIAEDPVRGLIYGLGFALGVYVGSIIEEKLAFGRVLLQVIVDEELEENVVSALRESKYAVTVMEGKGKDSKKAVLFMFLNRKKKEVAIDIILNHCPKAVVVANDVSTLKGGFFNKFSSIKK